MTPIWQKAAEFGLTAFLLVLVLSFGGYALWRIGNRVADALSMSFEKQADAVERTAGAVQKIGDLAAASQVIAQSHTEHLEDIKTHVTNHSKAMKHIIHAATEISPHALSPEQQARVRGYLDEAKRHLDTV